MSTPPNAKNVAILLTPPGSAAIAVVRLAGEGVRAFLGRQFSAPTPDGRCVHGLLCDEAGGVLDDAVVVCSADGHVADLNLHGGTWVVESVLQLAEREGFARVGAADLPALAHDGGSQIELEVLASLPQARTELALRTLLAQPRAWNDLIQRGASRDELRRTLHDRSLEWLLNPPRVAIIGAPNVGKSTLANQLFGQARSITADVPGTTRDWVGATANIEGLAVTLLDTPGVRETDDAIERESIARAGVEAGRADLVIVVLDASWPDEGLFRRTPDRLVVLNKSDRSRGEVSEGIATVATTGQGVDTLRRAILDYFGCADVPIGQARAWTERQRDIVKRAMDGPAILREIGVSTG